MVHRIFVGLVLSPRVHQAPTLTSRHSGLYNDTNDERLSEAFSAHGKVDIAVRPPSGLYWLALARLTIILGRWSCATVELMSREASALSNI